jgi:hypothetical protein
MFAFPVRPIALIAMLVSAVFTWSPSFSTPVAADHTPIHDPVARLQIVINKVIVHDISEPIYESNTELYLLAFLERVDPSCPAYSLDEECLSGLAHVYISPMSLSEGESRDVNRVIPLTEDSSVSDGSISTAFGVPVYRGQRYRLIIIGQDQDTVPGFDDFMGRVDRIISEGDNWIAPPHTQRAIMDDSGKGQGEPGKFSVEYEIRRIPLPDLEPTAIKVLQLAGSPDDVVCMSVLNRGSENAGPFEVWLTVDGAIPPLGKTEAGQLPSGQFGELCVNVKLPETGTYNLSAIVDWPRGTFEENDTNNRFDLRYTAPQNATGGAPTPTPSPGTQQADLFASGISVKGEQSGGTSGCDPGRNDITVFIKNLGGAPATNFIVHLQAKPDDKDDDDVSEEKPVTTLNPGSDQEVHFDDVNLKRGFYDLKATVDSKKSVSESDEDNNEFKLTVNCQSAS